MHASSTILRTLHDSVFRFSFFSKISLSLSPTILPPRRTWSRPPRIEKERRCAKVDEKTRCIPSISVWIGKPLREIASNRRGTRERIVQRDSNIIVYFCSPARRRRKHSLPRFETSRRWQRKTRGGEEGKKMVPSDTDFYGRSSIGERQRQRFLPLLQFEARLRVGSSSS